MPASGGQVLFVLKKTDFMEDWHDVVVNDGRVDVAGRRGRHGRKQWRILYLDRACSRSAWPARRLSVRARRAGVRYRDAGDAADLECHSPGRRGFYAAA